MAQTQNLQIKMRSRIKTSPLDYRSKCCPKTTNRSNCSNKWMLNNSKCKVTRTVKEVIRKVKNRSWLPMRRFQTLLESPWNSCNNLREAKWVVMLMAHLWAAKKITPHRTLIITIGIPRLDEPLVAVLSHIWAATVDKFTKMASGSLRLLQYSQFTKLIFSLKTSPDGLFIFIKGWRICCLLFALLYTAIR